MKFLRISHIFAWSSFQGFFNNNKESFREENYQNELEEIIKLGNDNCAALSRELGKIGFQTSDIYYDLKWLQMKWARENSVRFSDNNWEVEILSKQIEQFRPDIVFVQKSALTIHAFLEKLKDYFPFIKMVIVHSAYLGATGNFGFADLLLAGTPSLVHRFASKGLKPVLFYHYFDEEILGQTIKKEHEEYEVTFLGSSGFGHGFMHAERYFLLQRLIKETNLQLWISETSEPTNLFNKKHLRGLLKDLFGFFSTFTTIRISKFFKPEGKIGKIIEELRVENEYEEKGIRLPRKKLMSLFPERCHPPEIGLKYYNIMANSKISFHKQGGSVVQNESKIKGDIGALRLFEATGLGSCLVADNGANMGDLFEENSEIVTYNSSNEAVEKIKYLLANEGERKLIAKAGQKRTLRDHSAKKRAEFLSELIRDKLKKQNVSDKTL